MWMGTLNFGLVSMPVKLYSAVSSKSVHFHQLHARDHARIQMKRFCSAEEEEVSYDEIVRGYEIAPERYVVVEDAELEALAPELTRTIDIEDFVELREIDHIYLDQPYYVVPNKGGGKSYGLLLRAMRDTGKVAVARVVLRSRERLVAIHPHGDALLMTTMNFADEVRPTEELHELAEAEAKISERELDIARKLVESLVEPFDASKYRDTYREAVLDLIDRKASGEEIAVQPPVKHEALEAPDLMSALQASLEQVRSRGGGKPRKRAPATVAANGDGAPSGAGAGPKPRKKASSSPRKKAQKT
jgi:DNA end-binding protein Ku